MKQILIFIAAWSIALGGVFAEKPVQNAEEALQTFPWKFDSPANKGTLTFLPGGAIKKSWKQAFPWRWEAVGEREFTMHEMGGKRKKTRLKFNEEFTRFEGPGYSAGQRFAGERIAPQEETPPPAPLPEVTKSTVANMADNGPFITEQVLSALDEPSISEATVSLWKEDLLDEAAEDSATSQPAYQQAAALLDAWKAALRERYKIQGNAKYSGVVMDGPDMDASHKTTLHMWDWLMYARERDDAAKHEQKQQRKADFFAAGPPRYWADRSAALRPNIEKLYAAFRKARREMPAKPPASQP